MNDKDDLTDCSWMENLRHIYLSSSDQKLRELDQAITGLEMNPSSRTHERRLRRLLHNLIGSGASYGFPEVTNIARAMSECLQKRPDNEPIADPPMLVELRRYYARMQEAFGARSK